MTDSSAILNNTVGVSDGALFNLKPSAARSRSYKVCVAPINSSTFDAGNQMIFNIPCGKRNSYLDYI